MFSRYEKDKRPRWLRWFLFEVPSSATGEWWDKRDEMLSRRAPIRYYLQHDFPMLVRLQGTKLNNLWWKVRHRTTDRYHVVKTGLKPGYYETNDRLLHASFSLLVDYVEVGLASRNYNSDIKNPILRGLEHLDWEINDPQCAGQQAEDAKVVKDLYLWWTVERPERLDVWTAPEIWGDKIDEEDEKPKSIFRRRRRFKMTSKQPYSHRRSCASAMAAEEFYMDQDTSMLVRLAEIRGSLWS